MAKRMAIFVVLLAAGSLLATADEVIKFKNGHTMVVRSSRLEGTTLYLTLKDGSVLGFPSDLIQIPPEKTRRAYRGKKSRGMTTSSGGRGPRGKELMGYRSAMGKSPIGEGRLSSADARRRYSQQVGYLRPRGGEGEAEAPDRKKVGKPIQQVLEEQLGRGPLPRGGAGGSSKPNLPRIEARMAPSRARTDRVVDDR